MATIVKRGDKYRVQIRRAGHPTLSHTAESKAAAQRWARAQEAELDRRGRVDPGLRLTVADVMATYRKSVSPKGHKKHALGVIERHLGERRIAELVSRVIIDFARDRRDEGVGVKVIKDELTFLKGMLRYGGVLAGCQQAAAVAMAELDAARAVLRHSKQIGPSKERDRRPTEEEILKMRDYWKAKPRMRTPMWEIVLFAIATALRRGEISRLTFGDVDNDNRTLLVRQRKHPTEKETNDQIIPLLRGPVLIGKQVVDPLDIIVALKKRRLGVSDSSRIFPHDNDRISKAFTMMKRDLKLADLRFHDLRHEGISRLFEAGYSIEQVALISGHRDWKQLRRYTQIKPTSLHR